MRPALGPSGSAPRRRAAAPPDPHVEGRWDDPRTPTGTPTLRREGIAMQPKPPSATRAEVEERGGGPIARVAARHPRHG